MQNLYSFLLSLPGNCSIHYLDWIYSLQTEQATNFAKKKCLHRASLNCGIQVLLGMHRGYLG